MFLPMEKKKYSIGELADLTGVSRRTVRFYVQRGLIPPPEGAGRGSYYTSEHRDLITRIRALQGVRLQLDSIAAAHPGAPCPQPCNRTLVTRVHLAEGVALEFSRGVPVPDDEVLGRVARLLSGEADPVRDEEKELPE